MNQLWSGVVAVLMAIIGVAILSVIVSKNAQTPQVLQAAQQAFSGSLGTALSPVTGSTASFGASTFSMPTA
jgi:purine-cytosine permease-like protein